MAAPLPRLRADLDVMPSPLPDQPGLLIRDPFQYSTVTLIIPPLLARCLGCFDGEHDEGDLRAVLARLTGQVAVAEVSKRLVTALRDAGFLDDERFAEMRGAREREFAATPERAPRARRQRLPGRRRRADQHAARLFRRPSKPAARKRNGDGPLIGIAAPHVSPEGGKRQLRGGVSRAAARRRRADLRRARHVALRRARSLRADAQTVRDAVRRRAAPSWRWSTSWRRARGDAVAVEDYCHAVEHSIEFQVVFLQYLFGPRVRILPVLCGAFVAGPRRAASARGQRRRRGVSSARWATSRRAKASKLCFVLGVDFAHVGRRYGDARAARAYEGPLAEVAERDDARLDARGRG